MAGGDANAMVQYFNKMKADNDEFFYTYRTDNLGNMTDVLWVDARCKAAYEEFGDVVSFDSTYLTNRSELPFCNFVGVNSHGQTILFGCALISHEDVDTFRWLFRTWLEAMSGFVPGGFLTDQDAAMRKAISLEIPETRHRWCLWHIMKKFSDKLGKYSKYKEFKIGLQNAVYDSLTPEEFECSWMSVVKDYELMGNDWLTGLYADREMWVPAYMKHLFWAGMKTTQRSESIHSFFDGFVNKKTRLFEFPRQYCYALEVRADEERDADAKCWRKTRSLDTKYPFETQFRDVYTATKFKEVQLQFKRLVYVTPLAMEGRKTSEKHVVEHLFEDCVYKTNRKTKKEEASYKEWRRYRVSFNTSTHDASCECKLFECNGIMCRHLIRMYQMKHIDVVPPQFILRRWRKDIPRKHMQVKVGYHDPKKTEEVKRYDKLMLHFEAIAARASLLEINVPLCLELIDVLKPQVEDNIKRLYETADGAEATAASKVVGPVASGDVGDGGNDVNESLYNSTTALGETSSRTCTPSLTPRVGGGTSNGMTPTSGGGGSSQNKSSQNKSTPAEKSVRWSSDGNVATTPCQGSNGVVSVGDPILWRKKKGPSGSSRLQSSSEKAMKKKAKTSAAVVVDGPRCNLGQISGKVTVGSGGGEARPFVGVGGVCNELISEQHVVTGSPVLPHPIPGLQHQQRTQVIVREEADEGVQCVYDSAQQDVQCFQRTGQPVKAVGGAVPYFQQQGVEQPSLHQRGLKAPPRQQLWCIEREMNQPVEYLERESEQPVEYLHRQMPQRIYEKVQRDPQQRLQYMQGASPEEVQYVQRVQSLHPMRSRQHVQVFQAGCQPNLQPQSQQYQQHERQQFLQQSFHQRQQYYEYEPEQMSSCQISVDGNVYQRVNEFNVGPSNNESNPVVVRRVHKLQDQMLSQSSGRTGKGIPLHSSDYVPYNEIHVRPQSIMSGMNGSSSGVGVVEQRNGVGNPGVAFVSSGEVRGNGSRQSRLCDHLPRGSVQPEGDDVEGKAYGT